MGFQALLTQHLFIYLERECKSQEETSKFKHPIVVSLGPNRLEKRLKAKINLWKLLPTYIPT